MIKKYIGSSWGRIAYAVILVIIVNTVLLSSVSINKSIHDIIYMDTLLLVISFFFFMFGYFKFVKRYGLLFKYLEDNNRDNGSGKLAACLPDDSSFHSSLIYKVVDRLENAHSEKIQSYQIKMDELKDYMTKWVHEIKIPLSVLELIVDNHNRNSDSYQQNIKIELERTKFLINQVLYASRAAHYSEDLSISEFNLSRTVKEAVKRNSTPFIAKNIEVDVKPININLVNDEKWLSYILDQILNNASKYTDENGKIKIWTREEEKKTILCIEDDGIGIAPHDINRIFEKGFTGENGRKAAKSTGMGLYFSKKMADWLDIGLAVKSEPGSFTRFELSFKKGQGAGIFINKSLTEYDF